MDWSFEGLGFGYGSVAVANGKVHVTGIKDTATTFGTLFAFDLDGELLWQIDYGPDFCRSFHGTRSTPTVIGNYIYIASGAGAVYCFDAENGDEIWSVDFVKDLQVDIIPRWGYAESVFIDGNNLICVPGGKENNVVSLNRFTGEMVWSSKGYGEVATYNSPILINHNGNRLLIAMTSGSIMGINADTGEMYWRKHQFQRNSIHANTPLYFDGKIVVSSESGNDNSGLVQLQLSEDGKKAKEVWRNLKFSNLMSGIVRIDSSIYGSVYQRSDWQVISWNTGEILHKSKELGSGTVIYADGMFYCYTERKGEMALVEATPEKFEVISKFSVPLGTLQHWAHPVIKDGKLYIRHGNALMVYSISKKI
ncbi:MAG: PQQ-binding-like beta-propeller repeat protein [Draconibacterium sp.]|nr:PQQ-binding-like beta-propeller repeat protein [Draconibacterium sp.]